MINTDGTPASITFSNVSNISFCVVSSSRNGGSDDITADRRVVVVGEWRDGTVDVGAAVPR